MLLVPPPAAAFPASQEWLDTGAGGSLPPTHVSESALFKSSDVRASQGSRARRGLGMSLGDIFIVF